MKRLTIGLDIDGVIINYIHFILPLLSEISGKIVRYEDVTHPTLSKFLDVDEETSANIWKQMLKADLLQSAPPITGAIEGVNLLGDHEIWIITGRPVSIKNLTISWLNKNRIRYDRIVFDSGKALGNLSMEKHCDVFVDDQLEAANLLADAGVFTLLLDQPWNQATSLPKNCQRVYNWNEIIAEVNKYETDRG